MSDCPVCYSTFTSHLRKPVKCPYCDLTACVICIKTYLTGSTLDAHCMGCRRAWNDEFLDLNFTRAFRTGPWKKHREDVLMEREMSLLPTRQHRVEATIKLRQCQKEHSQIAKELRELELERLNILQKFHRVDRNKQRYVAESEGRAPPAWTLDEDERGVNAKKEVKEKAKFIMKCPDTECRGFLSTAYKCGTCQRWACPDCLEIKGENKDAEHTCNEERKASVKLILEESKACPKCGERISKVSGCFAKDTTILMWNGSVKMSQNIVVGDELVGDNGEKRTVTQLCSGIDEMYEVNQNDGLTYIVNSKHKLCLKTINGDIKEVIVDEYIKYNDIEKNKLYGYKLCGEITTISITPIGEGTYYGWSVTDNKRFLLADTTVLRNCDQMWCTTCNTAFSWTTGLQVNGVIHNPHYYEFLRKQGNGVAPRNAGDVPCGGVPYYHTIQTALRKVTTVQANVIMAIHRLTAEIADQRIQGYQSAFNQNDNGDLGVLYLMKKIDNDEMKKELAKRELKRNKHLAIRAVLEMFVTTSTMMLNNIVNEPPKNPVDFETTMEEYRNLKKYVNESLMLVSRQKNCSVPQIGVSSYNKPKKDSDKVDEQFTWSWLPFNKVGPKTKVVKKKGTTTVNEEKEDTDTDDDEIEVIE
jgi:hypothetical protein